MADNRSARNNVKRQTSNVKRQTSNVKRQTSSYERDTDRLQDTWLVIWDDAVSKSVQCEVGNWLTSMDIVTMSIHEALDRIHVGLRFNEHPNAIVGLTHSVAEGQRTLLMNCWRLARVAALVLVDESFDRQLAKTLLRSGTQDYLGMTQLDSELLAGRIEYAVLRNESRKQPVSGRIFSSVDWQHLHDVYYGLPHCEREVLDLMIAMRDQKQIARELDKGYTTVRTQVNHLREKFGVESTQQLVVLLIHALYQGSSMDVPQTFENGHNDDC